jgi:cellulose synthase/poly-beta-1,6-N-acetylglucosamine synthase-like glycosyltransferase
MILALQLWMVVLAGVMLLYAARHLALTVGRVRRRQRPGWEMVLDSDCPPVTVLIPMHNEERVAEGVLNALLQSDYPRSKLEIIPIDDHSSDATPQILDRYQGAYPFIKPLYRRGGGLRGKPAGLNDALALASHEIVLVFDADYQPGRSLIRELAMPFVDPEVGAVMGRVVPRNAGAGFLTRLLDLERSGGYQVDQQARYTLDLMPQYGGTVGGFRRSVVLSWGGFDPRVLAEDTDLTVRLYTRGWTVAYANHAECYEEAPETWEVRFRQLRRWARGHTQVMFKHWAKLPRSPYLSRWQKLDAMLLLGIYLVPPLLMSGLVASLVLFLTGSIPVWGTIVVSFCVVTYNAFGNFAPFYQVASAALLDGMRERLYLLPFMFFMYLYNTWAVSTGMLDAAIDALGSRMPEWEKTQRFRR